MYPLSFPPELVIEILFPALSVNVPPLIEPPFKVSAEDAEPAQFGKADVRPWSEGPELKYFVAPGNQR